MPELNPMPISKGKTSRRLDPYACYRLVEAMIRVCFSEPALLYPKDKIKQIELCEQRIHFAQNSDIIELYGILSGYDDLRIRRKIVFWNRISEEKLTRNLSKADQWGWLVRQDGHDCLKRP